MITSILYIIPFSCANSKPLTIITRHRKKAPRLHLWKGEYNISRQKIEHFLRCESKTIKSKVLLYCEILIYINDCMHKKNNKQCRKGIFDTSNLHNKCRLNKFPISGPAYRGEVVIHGLNTTRAISCKARNSPVEHPDWEYIFDSHSSGNQYHHYFSL